MPNTSSQGLFSPRMGTNKVMYGYTIDGYTPKKPIKPRIITEGKPKRARNRKKK